MRTMEHKNIPSGGGGAGFNPGSMHSFIDSLIHSFITICDYDEEKKIGTLSRDDDVDENGT